jgi:anti-sigma regulatory factor (Ser/Thr protein kinase)
MDGVVSAFFLEYFATKLLDAIIDRRNHSKEQSIEDLILCLFNESLTVFCDNHEIEFDDKSFQRWYETSKPALDMQNDKHLKHIIESALSLEICEKEFFDWFSIACELLVEKKYEKLYKAYMLQKAMTIQKGFTEPVWMQENMSDNTFEIQTAQQNQLIEVLSQIETNLSKECNLLTQQLIMEVLINAFEHGKAVSCSLLIERTRITVTDNGQKFDTTTLLSISNGSSGGTRTLLHFKSLFPEVDIKYQYTRKRNQMTIDFGDQVYNVNGLCEIIIPNDVLMKYDIGIHVRYPNGKAKYYYLDFATADLSFWTISGAYGLLGKLTSFCSELSTEVYIHFPAHSTIQSLEYFYSEISEYVSNNDLSSQIHLIKDEPDVKAE